VVQRNNKKLTPLAFIIMNPRDTFKTQLSRLYGRRQQLSYLLITSQGYLEVRSILFWAIGGLFQDYRFLPEDQANHILPVFRETLEKETHEPNT
jgi:hypothetical protein